MLMLTQESMFLLRAVHAEDAIWHLGRRCIAVVQSTNAEV